MVVLAGGTGSRMHCTEVVVYFGVTCLCRWVASWSRGGLGWIGLFLLREGREILLFFPSFHFFLFFFFCVQLILNGNTKKKKEKKKGGLPIGK